MGVFPKYEIIYQYFRKTYIYPNCLSVWRCMELSMVQKTISITIEQEQWLSKNPSINLSYFVRKAIDLSMQEMTEQAKRDVELLHSTSNPGPKVIE